MNSELLCLKWNNHNSSFIKQLNTLYSKDAYCDATLACEGKYYPVHKFVLSTCSEYFQEIFERTQCRHPFIIIKDIKQEDLQSLLSYMYRGEVNVPQATLPGLIKAAENLKIRGLAVSDDHSDNEEGYLLTKHRSKRRNEESSDSPAKKSHRRKSTDEPPVKSEIDLVIEKAGDNGCQSMLDSNESNFVAAESVLTTEVKQEPFDQPEESAEGSVNALAIINSNDSFTHSILDDNTKSLDTMSPDPQCSSWDSTEMDVKFNPPEVPVVKLEIPSESTLQTDIANGSYIVNNFRPEDYALAYDAPSTTFKCPFCPHSSKRKSHLKVHIQRKHSLARPYACASCDYRCSSLETLRMHSYRHNSNRKKYKCDYCPYESVNGIDVRRHTMKHTGERPFKCNFCDFGTVTRNHLNYHVDRCIARLDKTET